MKSKKLEFIIITILWIIVFHSFVICSDYDVFFVLGIISLLFTSTIYLIDKKQVFKLLLAILFLSIFNLFQFSYAIKIDPINFISILLVSILVYKRKMEFIDLFFLKINKTDQITNQRNRVDFFKREFKNLSISELENRKNDHILVLEAQIAIEELIKEKSNS